MKARGIIQIGIIACLLLCRINAFSDTIYCCQTDTLKLAYTFEGILYNEGCDINVDDILIITSIEPVFVSIEPASSSFNFNLRHKQNSICEFETYFFVNNVIEINEDGRYIGIDFDMAYNTSFNVIIGDAFDVNNPTILPQSIENPSCKIKIRNDFEYYQWSSGADSNIIVVDQPGDYIIEATNHCGEVFESTISFEPNAFNEDQFYAGKSSGENISYVDLNPDSTAYYTHGGPQGSKNIYLDINNDGFDDLDFYINFYSAMGGSGCELSIEPLNGSMITVDGVDKIAALLDEDQIVNEYNNFSGLSPIYLYKYYGGMYEYACSSGLWNESDNYLGFSIPNENDTLYGWMHISFIGNYDILDLVIDEYAYFSTSSNSLNEVTANPFVIYPNPFSDNLKINTQLQNYSIQLLDIFGKLVITQENMNGNIDVNLPSLSSGVYFLILESDTFRQTLKVIKQN
ncbi:T9SS type A sorting domain-containing protein [Desulfosarcina sp.]|nr:T9SS type A sorting domain-containing protein [Desulfosarcina sp.]